MRLISKHLISSLSIDLFTKKKKKRSQKIKKNPNTGKYHCEVCHYTSSRQFNVTRHKKRIHLPQIQRLCCDEMFETKGDWYKHCESVHPDKRPSYISKKKYKISTDTKSKIDDDADYGYGKIDETMERELNFALRLSKRIAAKHIRQSFIMEDEDDEDDDYDYDYDYDEDEDEDDNGYYSKDGDNKENQSESSDDGKDMNNNSYETVVNNNINYNISNNHYFFNDTYNNYEQSKSYVNEYFVNYYGVFDDDDDEEEEEDNNNNNNNSNDNTSNDNDENKENICPPTCSNQLPFKKRQYVRERNFGTQLSTITNIFNNKADKNEPVKIKMQNTVELKNLTSFQLGYLTDFDPEYFKIST